MSASPPSLAGRGGAGPARLLRVSGELVAEGGVPDRRGGVGGARGVQAAVEVAGLPRRYRAHVALAGVSFQVAPGESLRPRTDADGGAGVADRDANRGRRRGRGGGRGDRRGSRHGSVGRVVRPARLLTS